MLNGWNRSVRTTRAITPAATGAAIDEFFTTPPRDAKSQVCDVYTFSPGDAIATVCLPQFVVNEGSSMPVAGSCPSTRRRLDTGTTLSIILGMVRPLHESRS